MSLQEQNRDALDYYVAQISKYPVLTSEQENEIATEFVRTRDINLANKLVAANLRFVVKIAHKYRGYRMDMLELIQEGSLGLLKAVEKFDPSKGYRLISYAVWWIRTCMQNYIMRSWSLVKIGTTRQQRKLFFKLRSVRNEASKFASTGVHPTDEEMAKILDVKEREVSSMEMRMAARDFSLDVSAKLDVADTFLDRLVSDVNNPEEQYLQTEQRELLLHEIRQIVMQLDERERYVLEHRVMSEEPETLQQIGTCYHISRERARQVQEKMLLKIKQYLVEKGLNTVAA